VGIEEVVITPQNPWQNPYVERLVGSIHRECPARVAVFHEWHLTCILASYLAYTSG